MPVDKAFKEYETVRSEDYGKTYYDQAEAKADFEAGYEEGQKSLSPEARDGMKKVIESLKADADRCLDDGISWVRYDDFERYALKLEKLLAAGE